MASDVHVRLSETTVCALPEDHPDHGMFAVQVAWRGGERYAVIHYSHCLNADGEWDYEPLPSERDDGWETAHRFAYDEALHLAGQACLTITMNGLTVDDVLAQERDR